MKTKTRKIAQVILITIFIMCLVYPFIYWTMNPELTQMQVFLECWWIITIGFVSGVLNLLYQK